MIAPLLMAILNITPDSFHAPSRRCAWEAAIERGEQLFQWGADLIDVGGESSRPGAEPVPEKEELRRVVPVVKALAEKLPIPLSIDTYKVRVAEACIEAGARLINDICGFADPAMRALAADSAVELCVMHMQGTPQTMQIAPHYPNGVVKDLKDWFHQRIDLLLDAGVKKERIIIDPGIGFGKTVADNVEILQNLAEFRDMGFRVLVGMARKSFMQKSLNLKPDALLPATLAVHGFLLRRGVDILRIYDVAEHKQFMDMMKVLSPRES